MIRKLWQALLKDSLKVSIAQLCDWFSVLRRTVYFRPMLSAPPIGFVVKFLLKLV